MEFGLFFNGWQPWLSTMATNVAIAAVVAVLIWFIGVWPFLFVQLPIILLAGSAMLGAQQVPLYSQYYYDPVLYNPAFTGAMEQNNIFLVHRDHPFFLFFFGFGILRNCTPS